MERLLTRTEVAERLGMRPRTFTTHRKRLIAKGLQVVPICGHNRYREASLDRLIQRAAEEELKL